ncbi:PREDICTED: glucosidase 2 subunit beta-like [Ceratosolen solmsi marchali]|uniref:Glucosidase 2 subunit beta-like n=1 Tax=Ceratosolen solmsi marchali TaxID=326594 RepID=A0AAJ7DVU5_9HYME|nr:PREDICTED: glucosidase 2 subunit beta-like [Ceratosolen solmsi marchali]XP_011498254.1 PREDICTED: glucosidase 2 subunit beta-like [Ceratosolen solmsi marchali]XP_011498256.1 PREDICTED: glucosidase 2 subunit beta-like [Ceratosolen solmsi marchali]
MAPRKMGKRVENEVLDTPAVAENNDVSAAKKKKTQIEEQVTKEVRLPRAAKNKKIEVEPVMAKAAPRQKSAPKKADSFEKKSSGKNSNKKTEAQVDDTEKVEENDDIVEKPVKKGRGKVDKKVDVPIEKNYETDVKNKVVEEKTSLATKKGKGRGNKAEVVSKKARAKKDVENENGTFNSDVKDEDNDKESDGTLETKENGVESEVMENGKEEVLEEKIETKLVKKGKGKAPPKKGKTVSKSKVTAETNGDNEEDTVNEPETGVANSV